MADESYHRLLSEFRKRDNYAEVFRSALDEVADKVDFDWVKSCVAFGTGNGDREIELARRLLPNLRTFQAVEPDPESVKALRVSFQDNQLPGVETSVVETSLECWGGVDSPVDAVLLVGMLPHVHTVDRKAFFQKLMIKYLNPGGIVIIVDNICSIPSGYILLLERLGTPREDYGVVEKEMKDAGFRVVLTHDIIGTRDLSNPSDDVVKFISLLTDHKFDERQVRAAIDDVFSQPNMDISPRKLAVFAK